MNILMFDKKQCRVIYTFVHRWLPVYIIYMGVLKVKLGTVVSLGFDEHLTFTCTLRTKTISVHIFEGSSWSWSCGSWIYNNMCNQCLSPIQFPVHCEVYTVQHYVIKFVSDLWQVCGFLRVIQYPPSIKLTSTI